MKADLSLLGAPLLSWFEEKKRDLPWRRTKDPYSIWVSEIMLQQTRVEAVKGYYRRFLEELPDVESLAMCPQDRLMKLWEGLGYYNRVRNMQKAARLIMENGGKFPDTYEGILRLPGIGTYTAGAVGSIAFGLKEPAVDGNVLRVLSRVTDDPSDIALPSTKKGTEESMRQQLAGSGLDPGKTNQALMELGAIVCLPNGVPCCDACPWQEYCLSLKNGTIPERPVKTKKTKRKVQKKTVLVISDGEKVLLFKRPEKGLLAGLYEFPNLEGWQKEEDALSYVKSLGQDALFIRPLEDSAHIFSHVEWKMKGYYIRVAGLDEGMEIAADLDGLEKSYAIPSAFRVYTQFAKLKIRD